VLVVLKYLWYLYSMRRADATGEIRLGGATGVVTCLVAEGPVVDADGAARALEDEGAMVVCGDAGAMTAAFRRVSDAVRAVAVVRRLLPASSRVALSSGETGRLGEFRTVADHAQRLVEAARPGATVLSKLAANLALDHLPHDRRLCPSDPMSYELIDLAPTAVAV